MHPRIPFKPYHFHSSLVAMFGKTITTRKIHFSCQQKAGAIKKSH